MKKRKILFGLIFFYLLLVLTSFVSANNHTTENSVIVSENVPNKAYACLESKVNNQTGKFSLEQAIFGTLALGGKKAFDDVIKENKNSNNACWPSGCNLKQTAQVALAYQRTGQNTDDISSWILSKEATATGLTWYLEIDILEHNSSMCSVTYDDTKKEVQILDDMKIGQGAASGCFAPSSSGYWLQIADRCIDKKFEISCDKDFVTTLLYEKNSNGAIYVSSETSNAAQGAVTSEQVQAKCFKTGDSCDYEGSLWATLVLHKLGKDVKKYIPYLQALSEENKKYFPSTFLYFVQPTQEQFNEIVQEQKQAGFWEVVGSTYKRYYDSSLALLSIDRSGSDRAEMAKTKKYLESAQLKDGCWNARDSIVDTSFILYSAWPRAVSGISGGSGAGTSSFCSSASGASCESDKDACLRTGGRELTSYTCLKAREICCSVKVPAKTCIDSGGILCKQNEECIATTIDSSDSGICCSTTCSEKREQNTCPSTASCKSVCGGDEEVVRGASCVDSKICCSEKIEESEEGGNLILILIIGILILLIVFAILYRDKLQLFWHRWKGNIKTTPVNKPSSGAGVAQNFNRPVYRPPAVRPMPLRQNRPISSRDREMEETMRKLRDMSK